MPRKTPKESSPLFTASPSTHAAPPAAPSVSVSPSSPIAPSAPNVQSSSADGPPFSLEPRKPRLFWNGMERKPQVTPVPTQVLEIVRLLNQEGMTCVLVEQNVAVSLALSSLGYVLENGRITLSGSGEGLLADDRVRAAYLGM